MVAPPHGVLLIEAVLKMICDAYNSDVMWWTGYITATSCGGLGK